MQDSCGTILVMDDNRDNRLKLERDLSQQGQRVVLAENSIHAWGLLHSQPFDLILLDILYETITLPGSQHNDLSLLQQIKTSEQFASIPVIVISAVEDEQVLLAIEMGAEDYLPRPVDPILLRSRIRAGLAKKRQHDEEEHHRQEIENYNRQLEQRVQEQIIKISAGNLAAIFALAKLSECRDPDTGAHLERVRSYCKILAENLSRHPLYAPLFDESYIENIFIASPLHDVGKVGIPDAILLKNASLTPEEIGVMRKHTTIGASAIESVNRKYPGNGFLRMGAQIAENHHERWDGKGYPHGHSGQSIPLAGRIVALADVYDALTSKRCYKDALSHQQTCEIIVSEKEKQFDPAIVDCFLSIEGEFARIRTQIGDENQED